MRAEIFQAIRSKLLLDTVLTSYIGEEQVFRSKPGAIITVPAVTLQPNSESSVVRAGYNNSKVRDNNPVLQVGVWVSANADGFPCSGEDADVIVGRIDAILLDAASPIPGTSGWMKVTSSQQYEGDTGLWHNAARYSFRYSVIDS